MQELLYAQLGSQTVANTPSGTSFTWPKLVEGSDLVLGFRFMKRINGAAQEVQRNVIGWQAVIGPLDARPETGTIKIKFGTATSVDGVNVTSALDVATLDAATLQTAIRALSGLGGFNPAVVTKRDDSYFVTGANGAATTIALTANTTFPLSFLRIATETVAGAHVYGLRLVQAPVAFTDQQARVVAPGPVVTEVISGSAEVGSERNAIQKITFHPTSRFVYVIGFSGRTTTTLKRGNGSTADPSSGVTQIAAALNAIADTAGTFIVTNPDTGVAQIEFTGSMGKQEQPLLTVSVFSAPPGDVTCTLSLNTYPLWLLLNASTNGQVVLPLEIMCVLENELDDVIHEEHVLVRTDVTIFRRVGSESIGSAPNIDFAEPPLPESYIPFNRSQTGIGTFSYEEVLGDGALNVFTITHNQGSDRISNVEIIENTTPGRLYVHGTDFTVRRINSNVAEITIVGSPPGVDALECIITFAQDRTQFVEGVTFEIAQVTGLTAALASIADRLDTVESHTGIGTFTTPTEAADKIITVSRTFDDYVEIFGSRSKEKLDAGTSFVNYDTAKLAKRGGGLFAAVHSDSATALPTDLSAGTAGTLYQNQSGVTITLPGGLRHKSVDLLDDEFAAWSGAMWYKVAKEVSSEKTYYPVDLVRELIPELWIGSSQFPVGYELSLRIGLELKTILADVSFRYTLVIEHGSLGTDASPATTGENLSDYTWDATPLLSQELIIGPESLTAVFGIRLQNLAGGMVGKALAYGLESAAGSVPASNRFVLRARLVRPDTRNGKPDARGFLALRGFTAQPESTSAAGSEDTTLGKCIIKQI